MTSIAVLIPCFNEEVSIADVVSEFSANLVDAEIYVYDNNSSDRTAERAESAGAIVRTELQQGKGNVVRRMFADIDHDVYVLVDGDGTYDAAVAFEMVKKLLAENLDMVTGVRKTEEKAAYRSGHRFGNWVLTSLVGTIFGRRTNDMLSGYRVFSRRFVKSFPALSHGFEIETELTIHALELRMPIADLETAYAARLPNSESKLNTFRDGARILLLIASLVKEERPSYLFGMFSGFFLLSGVVLGIPVINEFMSTGLVPRLPTAVLSSALVTLSFLSMFSGLILDSITLARREAKRLAYLSIHLRDGH